MSATIKPVNQKAWFLILPVLICVAFSAIMPLMTVVNYSVQDIITPTQKVFVGTEWFAAIMRDEELHGALGPTKWYSFLLRSSQYVFLPTQNQIVSLIDKTPPKIAIMINATKAPNLMIINGSMAAKTRPMVRRPSSS